MKDGFFGLTDLYLEMFHKKGEDVFGFLCKNTLSKRVLMTHYKKFPPIENVTKKERWDLYRYVIQRFPEMERMDKMESARIIYTIGNLL